MRVYAQRKSGEYVRPKEVGGYTNNVLEAGIFDESDVINHNTIFGYYNPLKSIPIPKYEDQYGTPAFKITEEILDGKRRSDGVILREYTSAERKAMPIDAGCIRYFPDALAAIARVSAKGNEKHNPGEPLHWSRDKSNDHAECVTRHRLTPDAIDPESNETHRAHAAWRLMADLQIAEEKRLIAARIKPLSGVTK